MILTFALNYFAVNNESDIIFEAALVQVLK